MPTLIGFIDISVFCCSVRVLYAFWSQPYIHTYSIDSHFLRYSSYIQHNRMRHWNHTFALLFDYCVNWMGDWSKKKKISPINWMPCSSYSNNITIRLIYQFVHFHIITAGNSSRTHTQQSKWANVKRLDANSTPSKMAELRCMRNMSEYEDVSVYTWNRNWTNQIPLCGKDIWMINRT